MSNLSAFSYHTLGGYTPVYTRNNKSKHTGTVINIGPITIERIITSSGKEGYRVTGRERKIMTVKQLGKLRYAVDRELRDTYLQEYNRQWYSKHPGRYNERRRLWWQKNKDRVNAEKRAKYAQLKNLR